HSLNIFSEVFLHSFRQAVKGSGGGGLGGSFFSLHAATNKNPTANTTPTATFQFFIMSLPQGQLSLPDSGMRREATLLFARSHSIVNHERKGGQSAATRAGMMVTRDDMIHNRGNGRCNRTHY